jgi:hypothetical protein
MTPSIPLFQTLFAGLINVRVATHSSLRAFSKRMILNPAVLPLERHSQTLRRVGPEQRIDLAIEGCINSAV